MKNNFYCWQPKFPNAGTIPASGPAASGLVISEDSSSGTPIYRYVDGASEGGEVEIQFDDTNEIQNVCLFNGDSLPFAIDRIVEAKFRFKLKQAALNAATSFAIGLTGDRNDAIDSVAQAILLRIIGGDSTTAVVVETDDGTNDNNDVATGKVIADTNAHELVINFAAGKSDVRLFLDGEPLAPGTTFDMSNYSGALQFFAQIQKTQSTNEDGFNMLPGCYVKGRGELAA